MNQNDRKKQTHLRCERQRREAINSGYNELKDLLPASASFIGCKTTNAAILFRAADYVKALETSMEQNAEELAKLQTQYSALEMILQQYENFSLNSQPCSALQLQILQHFLDTCFDSFTSRVDLSNYQALTRSLLSWVECLDYQGTSDVLLNKLYKNH
ncbi:hypothetical protein niasHT_007214 [Heterodera trifolii]|uniref:BHLH domain-containing protein n=1 Tax=Heterodera trifolii TaxID=157864 RepID=A0ABD2LNL7_9BILA